MSTLDICHKKLAAIYCISYVINIAYIGNIKNKMSYGKYSDKLFYKVIDLCYTNAAKYVAHNIWTFFYLEFRVELIGNLV